MHSGTSMLQRALGASSVVFSTRGETKIFDFLPVIRRRFADLAQDTTLRALIAYCVELIYAGYRLEHQPGPAATWPELLPDDVDAIAARLPVREHARVFAAVMDRLAAREGKPRWLEKTPTHIFSISKIIEAVPCARFVEIVRDARDVLASKKTRRQTVWTTKRFAEDHRAWKHLEKAYDPLWDALSWKSAVRAGMAAAAAIPDRIVRVRYEDLVQAPQQELSRICRFLELPFEPAMLDVPKGQPADEGSLEQRGRGMTTDSVGRWRTAIPPDELALSQVVTDHELRALGYAHADTRFLAGLRAVPVAMTSGIELLQRLNRRRAMGGRQFLALTLGQYARRAARLLGGG